jgi:hypothetical protein
MMKTPFFPALALALFSASSSWAGIVYDNTTTDTLTTYFYAVPFGNTPFSQIGDSITLGGTDRTLTNAAVQFFNNGSTGTFTATLSFWNVGGPVGSQIGSSYVLNGLSINSLDILTVNFGSLNLLVPTNLIFTVGISNMTAGMDLGLNAFEPPSVGSSNNAQIITGVTSGIVTTFSTGSTGAGLGNLYFQLDATTIPEPSTVTMTAGGITLALLAARKRVR